MSLFHHHDSGHADRPADAASFEVLGADGKVLRFAHDDFDMIVETRDPQEVQRQVEHGWVILDERQVEGPGRDLSGEDLILGIEGLRVGGFPGHPAGETLTSYTIGCLHDGAHGELVE